MKTLKYLPGENIFMRISFELYKVILFFLTLFPCKLLYKHFNMFNRSSRYYLLLFLLVFLPLSSCGPKYKAARSQRQMEKRMEQRKKEGERALNQGRTRHMQMQSPETRQRMKETRRKSDRLLNNQKRRPFYIRWYNSIRGRR